MSEFASRTDGITPFQVMAILEQIEAPAAGKVHYTPALGLPELRQAIADFYQSRHGVKVLAKRIEITSGVSGVLLLLMADLGYPCHRYFTRGFEAIIRIQHWMTEQRLK